MLKLVYDVKCGFEDLFITEKNIEFDLASVIEANIEALETDIPDEDAEEFKLANPITEEDFYELYKDDLNGLLQFLEDSGYMACEEEANIEYYGKNYFAAICKEEHCLPGYYEDFNYHLVYEPNTKSNFYFNNAMPAKEVFKFLGINKQQLYYYVKTGKIRREYNEDASEVRYNGRDVYKLYNDQFNKKAKSLAEMTGCSLEEACKQLMQPKNRQATAEYTLLDMIAEVVNQTFHDILDSDKSVEDAFKLLKETFKARLSHDEYLPCLNTAIKMLENLLEAKLPENLYYSCYKNEFDILLSEEKIRLQIQQENKNN